MSNHKNNWLYVRLSVVLYLLLASAPAALASGYARHPQAEILIRQMVEEHGFGKQQLQQWFDQARRQQGILDTMARPAEKTKTWAEYRKIFLTTSRIERGVEFWNAHRQALSEVQARYGVPAEIIIAIIGVETRYGQYMGNHRVMDALSTLAFDYPPRQSFFLRELQQFLLMAREQRRDPLSLKGSYAGAMGLGQFMPSSYRAYAVDFDGDGSIDIWANERDAIASVANYFVRHGWRAGQPIVTRSEVRPGFDEGVFSADLQPRFKVAELERKGFAPLLPVAGDMSARPMRMQGEDGEEFWLGLHNFYVITRYNHSDMYALAVIQLSQEIRRLAEKSVAGTR